MKNRTVNLNGWYIVSAYRYTSQVYPKYKDELDSQPFPFIPTSANLILCQERGLRFLIRRGYSWPPPPGLTCRKRRWRTSSALWPVDHVNPWGLCANDNGYDFLFTWELILWLIKAKKIYQKLKGLSVWGESIKKKKPLTKWLVKRSHWGFILTFISRSQQISEWVNDLLTNTYNKSLKEKKKVNT